MKFRPGQEIICVGSGKWYCLKPWLFGFLTRKVPMIGPKKDEIVTVSDKMPPPGYVNLVEYDFIIPEMDSRPCYEERCFEPLISTSELESELQTIKDRV